MSDDSREGSPDWLRSFQAHPILSLSLSSDSESSPSGSPIIGEDAPLEETGRHSPEIGRNDGAILIDSGDENPVDKVKKPKAVKAGKKTKGHDLEGEIGDLKEGEAVDEDVPEKPIVSRVSSRLPLVLPEKVQRSKVLVECDDESIDLSGDVGAVGRIVISDTPTGNHEMLLDLKGSIYQSTIVPSRTFCIVSIGQTEAKIEAIMNDFVQLRPLANVFEAETMIEGTLDGFSSDWEDDGDRIPKPSAPQSDKDNKNGDQADARTNGELEKSSGPMRKKAKIAAKPPKKAVRKPQVSKKAKASKK